MSSHCSHGLSFNSMEKNTGLSFAGEDPKNAWLARIITDGVFIYQQLDTQKQQWSEALELYSTNFQWPLNSIWKECLCNPFWNKGSTLMVFCNSILFSLLGLAIRYYMLPLPYHSILLPHCRSIKNLHLKPFPKAVWKKWKLFLKLTINWSVFFFSNCSLFLLFDQSFVYCLLKWSYLKHPLFLHESEEQWQSSKF